MMWISLARGDYTGWGHLFLSATLTQSLRGRTELKLRATEFRGEATPVATLEEVLADETDSTRFFNNLTP